MRISILAPGSRGDVAPVAAVGQALRRDGHDVVVTAEAQYGPLVRAAGLEHVPITASMTPATPGVRAHLAALRTYMQAGAESALVACDGAELILCNPISPYGHDIAEATGAHSGATLLQPAHPSSAYPPMIASSWDLGARGNRLAGRLAEQLPTPYDPACAWVRQQVGLKPESRRSAQRRRRHSVTVHHGISPAVLPRPADWPENLYLNGYWWPVEPPHWQPDAQLEEFLAMGAAPLVVTLGSLPLGSSAITSLQDALRGSPSRLVLQGEQLRELGSELGDQRALWVGDVPHSWLFPRAAAVLHHAGAGVSAAALRAGVPSVTVPMHTDQPFWARRLFQLGAGTAPLPAKGLATQRLRDNIVESLTPEPLRAGAQRLKAELADEDGTVAVRDWVRRLG